MKTGKFHSLKTKTTFFLAVYLFVQICGVFLISFIILKNRFDILEQNYVEEHVERAQNSIDSELERISSLATDWGIWDDTFAFVRGEYDDFIENNMDYTTISYLNISLMVFMDNSGEVLYSANLDKDKGELTVVSEALLKYLKNSPLSTNTDPNTMPKGVIMLTDGPLLIAFSPILKSNREGPVAGNLVIGQYLDKAELDSISKDINLPVSIEKINLSDNRASSTSIMYEIENADTIIGYTYEKDLDSSPVFELSVTMQREISQIGNKGIWSTVLLLAIFSIALILLFMFHLQKYVLGKLLKLIDDVIDIGLKGRFNLRLPPQIVQDEFFILTEETNNMLDKLEESHTQLLDSEEELKEINQALGDRTEELFKANEDLKAEIIVREKAEEAIKHLAYHDNLTGLPNRLYFNDQLYHAIHLANRIGKTVAVIFLDLDGFKMINDSMGHAAGDEMLKEVATRLSKAVRISDTITRIGGDEFIIMVQDINESNSIDIVANKLLDCMLEPYKINGHECYITASIGIALYPVDGESGEELIKNADIAMYKAKENGKNQYILCSPAMKAIVIENMSLTTRLYRALDYHELELYYQPQINCETSKMVGAEALLRWKHPALGMVSPTKFIPLAEQSGLINSIGYWVMKTACEQGKKWVDAGYRKIRIGVNVSVKQFQNPNLAQQLEDILDETGFDPNYLELEVTESIALSQKAYIIDTLAKFKNLGVRIAIDDFGTGYSSLSYLKNLPIDRIKVAMPFIQGLEESEKDEAITKAIVVLAKNMGLGVIAEGVETEYQYTYLTQKMCDEIQGFYFYKPMPASELEELLRTDI